MGTPRYHKRFTLIELLVVIAIISLLAAMLLPALTQARSRARTSVCISNMHQVHLMFNQYFLDYNGRFPPLFVANNTGSTNWPGTTMVSSGGNRWHWWWREFLMYNSFGVTYNEHYPVGKEDKLEKYPETAVFFCPSMNDLRPELGQNLSLNMKNSISSPSGSSFWQVHREDKWPSLNKSPSGGKRTYANPSCILMYDNVGAVPEASDPTRIWRVPYKCTANVWLRHHGGANFLFGDGHVEYAKHFQTIATNLYPWSWTPWTIVIP